MSWLLLCAFLVFIMQVGFLLLETGLTRSKNSINVAVKNLTDVGVAILIFWAFGYAFMYGSSFGSWAGESDYFLSTSKEKFPFFLFQAMFCATASTILSGAVAERMRFWGYVVTTILICGLIYPIFGHWVWGGLFVGQKVGFLEKLGFIDFAGCSAVHSVGGWVSLAALLTIGPRLYRFREDGKANNITGSSLPMSATGAMLLWFGWFGFNGGSALEFNDSVPTILLNTLLSGCAGTVVSMAMGRCITGITGPLYPINGSLAGLVSVTAVCHAVSPVQAVCIGAIGAIVMLLAENLLLRFQIDDAIGAVPVHLGCGLWGTIAVALFGDFQILNSELESRWDQLQVQLVGIAVCAFWSFGVSFLFFKTINTIWKFRVSKEDEEVGLNISEHGASTELFDLQHVMKQQTQTNDMSLRVPEEPFTEVGQIAKQYNIVLDSFEKAKRETELRTKLIFENALDAVVSINENNEILTWNPQAEIIFGWSQEEVLGKDITHHIIPHKYRELHKEGMKKYIETGEGPVLNKRIEIVACNKSGREFPVELAIIPIDTGGDLFFCAFVNDITDRVNFRNEMKRAKELAEETARAKSEFLANMSHEIRTPMNGVIGLSGILLDMDLDEEVRDYVQTIQNSSESLLAIINDILDFSKIEAGKLSIEPIPFDLEVAIKEGIEMLSSRAQDKGLELILHYIPETPRYVIGDPGRIRQILTNLVGNSIKFTQKGHVIVTVKHQKEGMREFFCVTVDDTGVGIPEHRIDHLFEKFSQADASTTRKYGGTGLGLSICKQLVELMKGNISAKNRPEGGASFTFSLPLELDRQRPNLIPTASLKGLRVIVVDDIEDNGKVITALLNKWEINSDFFCSSVEALEAIKEAQKTQNPYHIAILDYNMPEMTGEELGKAIKNDPSLKDIEMLLITSSGNRGDAKRLEQEGFAGYFLKPIDQERVFQALSMIWGAHEKKVDSGLVTQYTVFEQQEAKKGIDLKDESQDERTDRLQILVVEDNVVNQKVAKKIIQKFNCRVDLAANGKEGVDLVEKIQYDLVFMDMQMPEMDGLEATRTIRKLTDPKKSKIPIVAMTANAMKGDREMCLDAGMNDYIAKPVKPENIKEALEKWAPKKNGE